MLCRQIYVHSFRALLSLPLPLVRLLRRTRYSGLCCTNERDGSDFRERRGLSACLPPCFTTFLLHVADPPRNHFEAHM